MSTPMTIAFGANSANHADLYPNPQPASKIIFLSDKNNLKSCSEEKP